MGDLLIPLKRRAQSELGLSAERIEIGSFREFSELAPN